MAWDSVAKFRLQPREIRHVDFLAVPQHSSRKQPLQLMSQRALGAPELPCRPYRPPSLAYCASQLPTVKSTPSAADGCPCGYSETGTGNTVTSTRGIAGPAYPSVPAPPRNAFSEWRRILRPGRSGDIDPPRGEVPEWSGAIRERKEQRPKPATAARQLAEPAAKPPTRLAVPARSRESAPVERAGIGLSFPIAVPAYRARGSR